METDKGQVLQMSDSRSPTEENEKEPMETLLERELIKGALKKPQA